MNTENEQLRKMHRKGAILALIASAMWGISGVVLQFVSQQTTIPGQWFIGTRTLVSGVILLLILLITTHGKGFFDIFKSWKNVASLLMFTVFGLLGNLYTFFYSVKLGNASSSTILQYLSPLFILLGSVIFFHKMPTRSDFVAFFMAMAGVFLLITRGDFTHLAISPESFFLGILSGLTAAMYVVFPKHLTSEGFSPLAVTGWGMFLAGVISQFIYPIWKMPHFTTSAALGVGTVILIGTLGAFLIMVFATKYVSSAIVSITDAVQPFTTFILSMIFLGSSFTWSEIIGSILVVVAIYILNKYQPQEA